MENTSFASHITNEKIAVAIENLLIYGCKNLGMHKADLNYSRNCILKLLNLASPPVVIQKIKVPASGKPQYIKLDPIHELSTEKSCAKINHVKFLPQEHIFDTLTDYAILKGVITEHERVQFETALIGCVTPMPAQVVYTYEKDVKEYGVGYATNNLFCLSVKSNYIRMADIKKNLKWKHSGKFGELIVTVNVAKPEKTAEQVAREAAAPKTNYPQCPLCVENEGYPGGGAKAARQTLRMIPIELGGEEWYMQFSPYQYYKEHAIALSGEHKPMTVTKDAIRRLMDFVKIFPHYFIGSNAALPIVGGSILSHDHYQGGCPELPLFSQGARAVKQKKFKDVDVSKVRWYNTVIRLESENEKSLLNAASFFMDKWKDYSDETANVQAYSYEKILSLPPLTLEDGSPVGIAQAADTTVVVMQSDGSMVAQEAPLYRKIPHNAVTPFARFSEHTKKFTIDLVLRNNRTTEEYPHGLFHPARHLHHIKQESIGLIEAAGIFILPGRLVARLESEKLTKEEINLACEEILETTAMFKNTPEGEKQFDNFIKSCFAKPKKAK
jgi:UDPglucose--hexose-1-phosphate uridylyltransferase